MFNAPLSNERAHYLIDTLQLTASQRVIDIGCGDGQFLHLLSTQAPIHGTGIDTNADLIAAAQSKSTATHQPAQLDFIATDAKTYLTTITPVDAIICIGAEYIFGGFPQLLQTITPLLKPGATALIGTIYWKQPPAPDYMAMLGDDITYYDLATTVEIAYQAGFLPVDVGRASDDEWDRFESRSKRKRYQDEAAMTATWHWQHAYLKWGMSTMGFCYLILNRPLQSSTSSTG